MDSVKTAQKGNPEEEEEVYKLNYNYLNIYVYASWEIFINLPLYFTKLLLVITCKEKNIIGIFLYEPFKIKGDLFISVYNLSLETTTV